MPRENESKTITREAFRDWLEHGTAPLRLRHSDTQHTLVKFQKTDNLDYLFEQTAYHGNGISWNDRFEFLCIHDRRDHILYLGEGETFPRVVDGLQPEDILDIRQLRKTLQADVNRLVETQIGNDRDNLTVKDLADGRMRKDVESYLEHGAKDDAVRQFLSGAKSSDIGFKSWYEIKGWTEDTLLSYLEDPSTHTQTVASRYIAENQERFLKQFLENDALIQRLQEIEADADGPIQRMKRISDAVKDSQAKSVTVTIQKDGAELTFKTEAASLHGYHSYYSVYDLAAPDRRQFYEMFGRGADYTSADITKITYGKRTLYEAAPSEPVQAEAPNQGITMGGMM